MTYYAGLDISMKETSIAIMDQSGKIVFETAVETEPDIIAQTLNESGFLLEKVGLESGCISFWLIEELKGLGISAICIETKKMATIIALKTNKTDKNDARLIADAMRFNMYKEVHVKTKESIEVGLQMNTRRSLVDTRTRLKNSVRGFLKAYGVRLGAVSHKSFPEMVRNVIEGYSKGVQVAIEGLLKSYEVACAGIEDIEQELDRHKTTDTVIALFETIPGVGLITALTYKAVIDNPNRFINPRDVGPYLGLTSRQYSSGDTVRQGRISKCGCTELRSLLIECAVVILTRSTKWTKLRAWGLKIMKRNGLKKAAVAVARKLAIIMLRMWQKMKPFDWGEKKESNKEKIKFCKKEEAKSEILVTV